MPKELTKSLSTRVAEVEKQAHEEGFQKREDERKVLFSKFPQRLEVQNEVGLLDELPVPEVFKAQVIVENQSFIDTTVNSSVLKLESVNAITVMQGLKSQPIAEREEPSKYQKNDPG